MSTIVQTLVKVVTVFALIATSVGSVHADTVIADGAYDGSEGYDLFYPVIGGPLSTPPPPPANPVPEPASLLLIGGAASGALAVRLRRRRG